jgi:hypothetical protein
MSDDLGFSSYLESIIADSVSDKKTVDTFVKFMHMNECISMMEQMNTKTRTKKRGLVHNHDPIMSNSEIESFCRNMQILGSDYIDMNPKKVVSVEETDE